MDLMDYIFRHKNIDVALLEIDPIGFAIQRVELLDDEHFPYGVKRTPPALYEWWRSRIIPASREGIKSILRERKIAGVSELALKSFGLSLSDQYWIVPEDQAGIGWGTVNFFDNEFAGGKSEMSVLAAGGMTPDVSTSGQLPKRWVIENGKRYLIKKGTPLVYPEAYNEKIGSVLCKHLGIGHVDYDVVIEQDEKIGETASSKCACFVDSKTELVTAYQIMETKPQPAGDFLYEHCIECFEEAGVPEAKRKIDEMLVLDFIISNTDRHLWNFGMIRNADTLKAVSFAPIYDCGNSMWHNVSDSAIRIGADVVADKANPFCTSHNEQIGKVRDFSWLEAEKLRAAIQEAEEVLLANMNCGIGRTEAIIRAFRARAAKVEVAAQARRSNQD